MSFFGFFLHHFLLCEINTPCISEYNIKRAHEYRIAMHQSVCVYSKHVITLFQTIVTTLKRDQTGLGFSIAGGRGSVPFKGNNQVHTHPHPPPFPVIWFYFRFIFHSSFYSVCHSYTGFTFTLKMIFGRKLPVELGKV